MGTRTYLRSQDRRQQLLDAASSLFDEGGYAAVTMVAVAREAGVSRRLLYDHFDDLEDLIQALFSARSAGMVDALDRSATAGRQPGDRSVPLAISAMLDVAPGDLRVIQLLLSDSTTVGLDRARDLLRAHLASRWLPVLGPARPDRTLVAGLLWAAAAAIVAVVDQFQRGEVDRGEAEILAEAIAGCLTHAVASLPPDPDTDPGVPS